MAMICTRIKPSYTPACPGCLWFSPCLRLWEHAQVPTVVHKAKKALQAGHAVVVGLQSTGEAAADALGLEPGQACGFVSTTREMLSRFVTLHFPTQYEPSTDQGGQKSYTVGAEHFLSK